jgi:hypothetical protein
MRLSLMKAALVDVGGAPWRKIRVARRFRPMYALANMGHPSHYRGWVVSIWFCFTTYFFGLELWYPTSREEQARCGAPVSRCRDEFSERFLWFYFSNLLVWV